MGKAAKGEDFERFLRKILEPVDAEEEDDECEAALQRLTKMIDNARELTRDEIVAVSLLLAWKYTADFAISWLKLNPHRRNRRKDLLLALEKVAESSANRRIFPQFGREVMR